MGAMLTVPEAAEILGCPAQKVRERMKRGEWKIGKVVKRGGRYQYDVFRPLLNQLIGDIQEGRVDG